MQTSSSSRFAAPTQNGRALQRGCLSACVHSRHHRRPANRSLVTVPPSRPSTLPALSYPTTNPCTRTGPLILLHCISPCACSASASPPPTYLAALPRSTCPLAAPVPLHITSGAALRQMDADTGTEISSLHRPRGPPPPAPVQNGAGMKNNPGNFENLEDVTDAQVLCGRPPPTPTLGITVPVPVPSSKHAFI